MPSSPQLNTSVWPSPLMRVLWHQSPAVNMGIVMAYCQVLAGRTKMCVLLAGVPRLSRGWVDITLSVRPSRLMSSEAPKKSSDMGSGACNLATWPHALFDLRNTYTAPAPSMPLTVSRGADTASIEPSALKAVPAKSNSKATPKPWLDWLVAALR